MYETIAALIADAQYDEAENLIAQKKAAGDLKGDVLAVLEAEIWCRRQDRDKMFAAIADGICCNYANYELFFMLGGYYETLNPYQAFLCYQNAESYCDREEDRSLITNARKRLEATGIAVPNCSVVILSYNVKEKMQLCLESIRKYTSPAWCEVIVIDNASTDGVTDYLKQQNDITLICNSENVGFPAGCNQGIKEAAKENDIFLLNNDTILTPNAVFWLRMGLYEKKEVGAAGSVSNAVPDHQKIEEQFETPEEYLKYAHISNVPMKTPYERKVWLIGFALMLKRTVLDMIGFLDERFSPGNFEDNDLSFRMMQAGYQMLLCKNSFIFHFGHSSFVSGTEHYNRLLQINKEKAEKKWGFDPLYYSMERRGITELIHHGEKEPIRVLEVGCGLGATLGYIRDKWVNASVYGIELERTVARLGKNYIPDLIQGDIETMELDFPLESFDYIIFADVLECLRDPEKTLKRLSRYLKPSGSILASIYNLMHYSVILDLLKGNFTRQGSGVLDKTHLHFFTLSEIARLFLGSGYQIEDVRGVKMPEALSAEDRCLYYQMIKLPAIASEVNFQSHQFLISAGKR